jgi:hypothetical protein
MGVSVAAPFSDSQSPGGFCPGNAPISADFDMPRISLAKA